MQNNTVDIVHTPKAYSTSLSWKVLKTPVIERELCQSKTADLKHPLFFLLKIVSCAINFLGL